MSNGVDPAVSDARRRLIVEAVRGGADTSGAVLVVLRALHAEGRWPQAAWAGARNAPYSSGTSQMMHSLCCAVWLVYDRVTDKFALGLHAPPPPDPAEVARIAETMLPQDGARDALLARMEAFRARTGLDIALGVTDALQRCVRVDTPRGMAEWILLPEQSWEDGLLKVGATA